MAIFETKFNQLVLQAKHSIGIFYAICGAVCLTLEDMILYVGGRLFHPTFIFACNSVIVFCLCLSLVVAFKLIKWRPVSSAHFTLVFLFGTFSWLSQITVSLSVFSIGPGNSVALTFTVTIFSVIFSVIFLKTGFQVKDFICAICSTGGVALIAITIDQEELVITQFTIPVPYGIISALLGAMTFAASFIIGNHLASYDSSHSIVNVLSYACQYSLVALVLCTLFNGWSIPETTLDVLILTSTGLTTFGGVLFSYLALDSENPTTVSVIMTSQVIFNHVGQFIFFEFRFH